MKYLVALALLCSFSIAEAVTYQSPNGRTEECTALPEIPGADISDKDRKKEKNLCDANFYAEGIALCPKTNSTSAAAVIRDIEESGLTTQQFENSPDCGDKLESDRIAKFKITMNQKGTSGTTSGSSIMYYHMSRYLDTLVEVPVAVLRTMDKDVMGSRVAARAKPKGAMNRAAWNVILAAVKNPASYVPTDDVFTKDRQQFWGVMLDDKGERYGAEINSARKAGWGAPQSREFQTTPAFTALRTEGEIEKLAQNSQYSPQQMAFWMRELSEIAVLDHIFSQQDRVGNVDYVWHWYWVDNGKIQHQKVKSKVPRSKMNTIEMPAEIAQFKPVLLQRTWIGDNDAGLNTRYANFAKQTDMVKNLRHFNASVYVKLQKIARDFAAKGPLYTHVANSYGMTAAQLKLMTTNTIEVASILNANCHANKLRFDLSVQKFMRGEPTLEQVACDVP